MWGGSESNQSNIHLLPFAPKHPAYSHERQGGKPKLLTA